MQTMHTKGVITWTFIPVTGTKCNRTKLCKNYFSYILSKILQQFLVTLIESQCWDVDDYGEPSDLKIQEQTKKIIVECFKWQEITLLVHCHSMSSSYSITMLTMWHETTKRLQLECLLTVVNLKKSFDLWSSRIWVH